MNNQFSDESQVGLALRGIKENVLSVSFPIYQLDVTYKTS
jgi:hypothetical protein